MAKNPFKVLGVSESVTQSELDDAYNRAKAPYEEERFYEGDRGDTACRKLTELREAYDEATAIISAKYVISEDSDSLIAEAEQLLKDGRIDEAQDTINRVKTDRNARWHFIQAGIYFKRDWLNDALAELRQAMTLDPTNTDYSETYQHVNAKMNGQSFNGQNGGFYQNQQNGQDGRSYTGNNNPYQNGYRGPSACDCCSSLICADCCCECMGGDLIRCC